MSTQFRILHVDDDPEFAEVTADFLEREDNRFETVTEMDATVVLDRLIDGQFDCVVSDYQMPGTNGLELLDAVREEFPDLPFVLFTNHGSEQVAAAAIEKGVTSYLQKETGGTAQYAMLANRIRTHVRKYRAERRANRLEREYELIDRAASDVFWTFDHATRTAWFSDGIQHFGYDPDRIEYPVDADWLFERIHPDDRERVRGCQNIFPAEAEPTGGELERGGASIELRFRRADGSYADCHARGIVVCDDGELSKVVGTLRDVTERKQRQRRLDALSEAFPDIAFIIDETGRHVELLASPASEELLYTDPDEMLGRRLQDLFPAEKADELLSSVRTTLETGRQQTLEYELDVPAGTRRLEARTTPLPTEIDGSRAVVWVARDVTERTDRERELERQNARLEEFVSIVSHDLRNPLSVATARLTLAREDCESDHLEDVERAHDRMQTLIEDLLALARQGETPTEVTAVSLQELVEESWQNVETGTATLAVGTGRAIRANPGRLAQLFENLFRNSVEHGSTSSRTESGDGVEHSSADVTVTVGDLDDGFYVADDGPGFDSDERDRAFDSGYSTTEDGTGFGLSIVREIVDAHDWDVRITDGPDGGAQFEVTGVEFTTTDA